VPTTTLDEALERLRWSAACWHLEVFHRTLKSGCRIEDRRLGDADSLQACLAIDLVVAWRVMALAKLGRATPDIPGTVFFEETEWQALACHHQRLPTPPQTPPTLSARRCAWSPGSAAFSGPTATPTQGPPRCGVA
jgi:hypothetical protein